MKILITGATGFIGRDVCKALAFEGHDLIVISRNKAHARLQIPAPHQGIQWDLSSPLYKPLSKEDELKLAQLDGVIHLAGESLISHRWTPEFKKKLFESRVNATENL